MVKKSKVQLTGIAASFEAAIDRACSIQELNAAWVTIKATWDRGEGQVCDAILAAHTPSNTLIIAL